MAAADLLCMPGVQRAASGPAAPSALSV